VVVQVTGEPCAPASRLSGSWLEAAGSWLGGLTQRRAVTAPSNNLRHSAPSNIGAAYPYAQASPVQPALERV
jgi:hypothetical protein